MNIMIKRYIKKMFLSDDGLSVYITRTLSIFYDICLLNITVILLMHRYLLNVFFILIKEKLSLKKDF